MVFNANALASSSVSGQLEEAKSQAAQVQVKTLEQACQVYYLKNGDYPDALKVLVKDNYVEAELLQDPWKTPYRYDPKGPKNKGDKPDIWTVTPGGKTIGNWKEDKKGS
jgi:type II secretory pathway pseudopilin PulG